MTQFSENPTFSHDALPTSGASGTLSPVEDAVVRQVDWYMGRLNLQRDEYLKRQMDHQLWVTLDVILAFPKMLRLGLTDKAHVAALLHRHSTVVEVDMATHRVRPAWARRSTLVLHPPPSLRMDQLIALLQSSNPFTSASSSSSSFDASNHSASPPVLVSLHPSPDGALLATFDSPGGAAAAHANLRALDLTFFGHRISAQVLPDSFLNPPSSTFSSSSTTPESPFHTPPPPPPPPSLPVTVSMQAHAASTPIHPHSLPHGTIPQTPVAHAAHGPPPAPMLSSPTPLLTALPMGVPILPGHPHLHPHHHSPHPHTHRQVHPHPHVDPHMSPFSLQVQQQQQSEIQFQSVEQVQQHVQTQGMPIHRQFLGARSVPPAYVMPYAGSAGGVGAGPTTAVGQHAPLHHFDPVGAAAAAAAAASLHHPQVAHPHVLMHSHPPHHMHHPLHHMPTTLHPHMQPHPPLQQFHLYPQPHTFAQSHQQPPQMPPYVHNLHPPTPPPVPAPVHGLPRIDIAGQSPSVPTEASSPHAPTRNVPAVRSSHANVSEVPSTLPSPSTRFLPRDNSHQTHCNHPNNAHHGRNNTHTYIGQGQTQSQHLRPDRSSRGDAVRYGSQPDTHGSTQPGFGRPFAPSDSRGFNHRKGKKGSRGHHPMRGGHAFSSDSRYYDRRSDRGVDSRGDIEIRGESRFVSHDVEKPHAQARETKFDPKNFPPLRNLDDVGSSDSASVLAHGPARESSELRSSENNVSSASVKNDQGTVENFVSLGKMKVLDVDRGAGLVDAKPPHSHVTKESGPARPNDRTSDGAGLSYAAILRSKKLPSKQTSKADSGKIDGGTGKSSEWNNSEKEARVSTDDSNRESRVGQTSKCVVDSKQATCVSQERESVSTENPDDVKQKGTSPIDTDLSAGSTNCNEDVDSGVEEIDRNSSEYNQVFGESVDLKTNGVEPTVRKDESKANSAGNSDAENGTGSWTKVRGEWRANSVWANKPKSVLEAGSRVSSGSGGSLRSVPVLDGQDDDGKDAVADLSMPVSFTKANGKSQKDGSQDGKKDADGGRWVKAGRKHWNRHTSATQNANTPNAVRPSNPTRADV